MLSLTVSLLSLVGLLRAQCTDVLVDDFVKLTQGFLPNDPELKYFNLLEGDYGSLGANFSINTAAKQMTIVAGTANVGQPEASANPGTASTFNYWYPFVSINY